MFEESQYQVENRSLFDYNFCSSDGKQFVCLTYHRKLLKGQPVYNNLQVVELPGAFRDIRKLENIIISKRLLFKGDFNARMSVSKS